MALNVTNYTFDLDMVPNGFPPVVPASQGDTDRRYVANLYWSGQPWTPASGVTVKIHGKKPDKTVFEYGDNVSISGSTVTITTKDQMTIVDGSVVCELVFMSDGKSIATANFIMLVEEKVYDSNALSKSDVETLSEAVADMMDDAIGNKLDAFVAQTKDIGDKAVTTPKIADKAVTTAKLDPDIVSLLDEFSAVLRRGFTNSTIAFSQGTLKFSQGNLKLNALN